MQKGSQELFLVTGKLLNRWHQVTVAVPRPPGVACAPPRLLRRWPAVTEAAVAHDPQVAPLQQSLIRGDGSPRNVGRDAGGRFVYLDPGFCAQRSRMHELACRLAFRAAWLQAGGPAVQKICDSIPALA